MVMVVIVMMVIMVMVMGQRTITLSIGGSIVQRNAGRECRDVHQPAAQFKISTIF